MAYQVHASGISGLLPRTCGKGQGGGVHPRSVRKQTLIHPPTRDYKIPLLQATQTPKKLCFSRFCNNVDRMMVQVTVAI